MGGGKGDTRIPLHRSLYIITKFRVNRPIAGPRIYSSLIQLFLQTLPLKITPPANEITGYGEKINCSFQKIGVKSGLRGGEKPLIGQV